MHAARCNLRPVTGGKWQCLVPDSPKRGLAKIDSCLFLTIRRRVSEASVLGRRPGKMQEAIPRRRMGPPALGDGSGTYCHTLP